MSEKNKRNAPCPCGSGKKYKKCCLQSTEHNADLVDFGQRQLRQLEGQVVDNHLLPYTLKHIPNDLMQHIMIDCLRKDLPEELPDECDLELLYMNFLVPWLIFNWIPEEDYQIKGLDPDATIAQNYLTKYKNKLNSQEKRFITAITQSYYSFYSILKVVKDKYIEMKDILLGTTHVVKEKQGTHQLKRGDILYTRIITIDNQSIMVGGAPIIIQTHFHGFLLDTKAWLIKNNGNQPLTGDILRQDFERPLLDCFFDILKKSYNPPLPTLVNTDGEPMQLSKSYFELTMPPEAALERLLPLTLSHNKEELLQDAECQPSGSIQRIHMNWLKPGNSQHKDWENTVMGHITIEEKRLILETNSENRTQQGKKLLTQLLGDKVIFQQTSMQNLDQIMRSASPSHQEDKDQHKLLESPEVQAQLQAMATSHWQNWFDEPIPMLNDETPRQAAQTEQGRERLEALLLQYERHDVEKISNPCFKADINYLRTELKLDEYGQEVDNIEN